MATVTGVRTDPSHDLPRSTLPSRGSNTVSARTQTRAWRAGRGRRAISCARPSRRAATRLAVIRRVLGLALLAVVTAGTVVVSTSGAPAVAESDAAQRPQHIVLGEGDTVWDLAHEFRPEGMDHHSWVRQIVDHNAFDVTALPPGTVVQLPRS